MSTTKELPRLVEKWPPLWREKYQRVRDGLLKRGMNERDATARAKAFVLKEHFRAELRRVGGPAGGRRKRGRNQLGFDSAEG